MAEPTIIARLGLDAKSFQRELAQAVAQSTAGGRQIERGLGQGAEGGERLFTSSHRVAGGIHRLTEEISRGAAAGDIFGSVLYGMERAMRLPIGALAGLAIGAVIVKQLVDVREEYKKLQDQTKIALFPTLPSESAALDSLIERIKNLNELIKKNQEADEKIKQGGWGGLWQRIKDATAGMRMQPYDAGDYNPDGTLKAGAVDKTKTSSDIRAERQSQTDALLKERARDYTNEEAKIRRSGVDVSQRLAALAVERAKTEMDTAKTVEEKQRAQLDIERAQLEVERLKNKEATAAEKRLAEIATPQDQSNMRQYQPRIVGYDYGANIPQARAEEIQKGMAAGKTDGKELTDAVDRSSTLRQIEKNTRDKPDYSY